MAFLRDKESYRYSTSLFLRGLALVYFIAFASLIPQIAGLIGSNGILPASGYLTAVGMQFGSERYVVLPTVFWFNSSDAFLRVVCWVGAGLAAVFFMGIAPLPILVLLWILYLSIANVGQDFLLFQWDALLLEAGFAAILLVPHAWRRIGPEQPPLAARYVFQFLIFRLMLESGLVKLLSGDKTWRDLTALNFHYETQPLPTPLAWYAHHLPAAFHKASVIGMFAVELLVPFLFWMPRRFRIIGAWITIAFQIAIAATGNYTFFNLLTIVLCIPLLDDRHLRRLIPWLKPGLEKPSARHPVVTVFAVLLISVGIFQLIETVSASNISLPGIAWLDNLAETWNVVNRYGLFAVMTTSRPEIIVEGSNDGEHWREYEFRFKAGDPYRAPRWVAPYQPRLDWQMWFAALSYRNAPWFQQFAVHLLEGSPDVLRLLRSNPFPDQPPTLIRANVYDYHFTDSETRRSTGGWWTRQYLGEYLPPVSLKQ